MLSAVKTFRAAPVVAARRSIVVRAEDPKNAATEVAEGFKEDVKDSLEPRVDDLKKDFGPSTDNTGKGVELNRFDGPLPEVVNGRLAMLGFTAGLAAEVYTHQTIGQQFQSAPGLVLAGALTFILASLIPLLRGSETVKQWAQDESFGGAFNFTTELINGRAAMIGIALIIGYETITGAPLF